MIRNSIIHDDLIKWKHFPRYWPFVSPVNSPHKGQQCEALMFSLICAWTNRWVKNPNAGHLKRYRAHYDVTLIYPSPPRQLLTIATIIMQPISQLFNCHGSTKYSLSATFIPKQECKDDFKTFHTKGLCQRGITTCDIFFMYTGPSYSRTLTGIMKATTNYKFCITWYCVTLKPHIKSHIKHSKYW